MRYAIVGAIGLAALCGVGAYAQTPAAPPERPHVTVDADATVHIPPIVIPPSAFISPEAKAMLRMPGGFGLWRPGAGFVLVRAIAGEAEILTLAVLPEARRQGLGQGLMAAALARAAARGAAAMLLEVATDNAPAQALYASLGFAKVGRRRRYYADGRDALVLRRELALTPPCAAAGR
jgi:ribosomal-protein-alanine N-acetyltransferase